MYHNTVHDPLANTGRPGVQYVTKNQAGSTGQVVSSDDRFECIFWGEVFRGRGPQRYLGEWVGVNVIPWPHYDRRHTSLCVMISSIWAQEWSVGVYTG